MTRNDNGKAKAGETEALLEKEKGMTNKTTTSKKEKSKETAEEGSKHDDGSKFEYEFGGPVGALATTLSLPVVVLLLDYWSDIGGVNFKIADMREYFLPNHDGTSWLNCLLALIGWFVLQILLERLLPCELVQGMPVTVPANTKTETTTTTKRLTYRINGHLAFWITWLLFVMGVPYVDKASGYWQLFVNGPLPLYQFVVPNYSTLALLMILLCFVMSVYLYANSFRSRDVIVAKGGNSGNACYDFFIGRELNPRCLGGDATGLDIKEFCELRPGLIGWMVLNVAFAQQQHSELGYITGSMYLINIFQGIYVWDALYQERAILSTMDITTDGFGYMLCFGDLCWVPFTYSLQAKYLVKHDPQLSGWALIAIVLVHAMGYAIFRLSNAQKDQFRRNPNDPAVSHLQFMETKRGTKLLVSGWWGMARKINYTGDYLMALSWCMVCGAQSLVPYYYAIYFLILLIHRSIRDDHMCHEKYGDDWNRYKQKVPYRFIPGII